MKSFKYFCASALACLSLGALAQGQIVDPFPPIPQGPIRVELQALASGLTAPNNLLSAGDGTSRLFVADQAGQVRIIEDGQLLSTPFLDLGSRLVALRSSYDERGLLGLAFDPGFADPQSPGHGKLYTYTSEPIAGLADFTVPMPSGVLFNHQSVVTQWQVSAADPDVVDPASRRELFRIDQPQSNHNGGMLAFGPDRMLYISLGDGGRANDVGDGHNPSTGNAQNLSTVLGKMLRIDVHGNNSLNGQYGIPADNPFVSGGAVPEIYALGFRNPFRFSFDRETGDLWVADVGQNQVEELDQVIKGGNYGWRLKEGAYSFNPIDGAISEDTSGLPPGLIDPVLQYDHDEGTAIIGGFVYRGSRLPELAGKYVFGDLSDGLETPNGRLFYADLATGEIRELQLDLAGAGLELFLKGLGEGADGELYVLATTDLGPSGTSGVVFQIVPEPGTAGLLGLLGGLGLLRRRRHA